MWDPKNGMNRQIVAQNPDHDCAKLCPVELSVDIILLAKHLWAKDPDNPLCLFQTEDGSTEFLTGDMITKYYCYVTTLVFPTISETELRLTSTHSARVKAACLFTLSRKGWHLHQIENSMAEKFLSDLPMKYIHDLLTAYDCIKLRQRVYFEEISSVRSQHT